MLSTWECLHNNLELTAMIEFDENDLQQMTLLWIYQTNLPVTW